MAGAGSAAASNGEQPRNSDSSGETDRAVQVEGRMPGDRTVSDDIGAGRTGNQTEPTALAALPLIVLATTAADAAAQDRRGDDGHTVALDDLPEDPPRGQRVAGRSHEVVHVHRSSHVLARPPSECAAARTGCTAAGP